MRICRAFSALPVPGAHGATEADVDYVTGTGASDSILNSDIRIRRALNRKLKRHTAWVAIHAAWAKVKGAELIMGSALRTHTTELSEATVELQQETTDKRPPQLATPRRRP